ncbi:MAG: peptide deformylase [Alphaproteobacteria bacterium]|nr:peptide deformylase [Alphaproteobacteria bacterium]
MTAFASQKYEKVVTCDEDSSNCLRQATKPISLRDWAIAKSTVEQLFYVRETILKGGAGLAAPQIGISQPIFIYTPDRTTESLRVVINPSFEPIGHSMIEGSEACFSVPLRCTKLKRWETIKVKYQNLDGELIEQIIDGFEAKVFQHEMDHLKGHLTIDHDDVDILIFTDPKEFQEHMQQVHLEDAKRYRERCF